MKVKHYTHILRKCGDIDNIKKINLGSRTDFKRQIIKGKLRHKRDELRGFNIHLIGVLEERLEEKKYLKENG